MCITVFGNNLISLIHVHKKIVLNIHFVFCSRIYCEVCGAYCSGIENMKDHLAGRKHRVQVLITAIASKRLVVTDREDLICI